VQKAPFYFGRSLISAPKNPLHFPLAARLIVHDARNLKFDAALLDLDMQIIRVINCKLKMTASLMVTSLNSELGNKEECFSFTFRRGVYFLKGMY
jgi:hypothetical protein